MSPRALWFSDRPARQVGSYRIPELIRTFFADQAPPNAALEFAGADGPNRVVVVELSTPRYRKAEKELRFDARVLGAPGDELGAETSLGGFVDRHDGRVARSFDDATLFVDSAPGSDAGCIATNADETSAEVTELTSVTCSEAQSVIAQLHNGECPANFGENWLCGFSPTGTHEYEQTPNPEFVWGA